MSRTFLKFFQGFSLFLCPPGLFRRRSSDSLHMIPPQDPFVKHFLTKTDSYFWIFLPETGVHDWRNPQNLPLGEGAAAAAEEGRHQVRHRTAPHPSGLRPATLSQERVRREVQTGPGFLRGLAPLIRQGLWPCHLPRRGRLPPAGASPRRGLMGITSWTGCR